jgi:hypothetical protein
MCLINVMCDGQIMEKLIKDSFFARKLSIFTSNDGENVGRFYSVFFVASKKCLEIFKTFSESVTNIFFLYLFGRRSLVLY